MPPYGKAMRTLAFSCGRRGTAERWMRSWHLADAVFDGGLQAGGTCGAACRLSPYFGCTRPYKKHSFLGFIRFLSRFSLQV